MAEPSPTRLPVRHEPAGKWWRPPRRERPQRGSWINTTIAIICRAVSTVTPAHGRLQKRAPPLASGRRDPEDLELHLTRGSREPLREFSLELKRRNLLTPEITDALRRWADELRRSAA